MVITLSRQTGSGGDEIAELVASQAGLRLADRLIVEQMAQRTGVPLAAVQLFDDTIPGAVESLLAEWQSSLSHMAYLRRLVHTLLSLEHQDNVVMVGRGAAFVLQNPGTFHARIIAPLPCRVARLVDSEGVSPLLAERHLRRSDEDRQRFVRQSFGADIDNPEHYDLMLNTAEMSSEAAAEMILHGAQRKACERLSRAPEACLDVIAEVHRLARRPHRPRVSEAVWQSCQRRRPRPVA